MAITLLIDILERNKHLRTEAEALAFDSALQSLNQPMTSDDLRALLKVFTDECQNTEVMYGLIHLVESFENETYIPALLNVLPSVNSKAAEWMKRIHFGILNDSGCRASYKKAYKAASPAIRETARNMLLEIEADAPEFSARVREIIS